MTDLFLLMTSLFILLSIIFGMLSKVRIVVFDSLNNDKMQIMLSINQKLGERISISNMNDTFSMIQCLLFRYQISCFTLILSSNNGLIEIDKIQN